MQFLRFWENLFVKFSDDFRYKSSTRFFRPRRVKIFARSETRFCERNVAPENFFLRKFASEFSIPVKCAQSSRGRKSGNFLEQICLRFCSGVSRKPDVRGY